MSRWKAAGIHLSISLLIGLALLSLLLLVWYPAPYFAIAGGQNLMLTLLGVDLVAGPLLTLIVFKAGKRGLKFDLSVIALLQASALAYGLNVTTAARPAFIVAAVDRFIVVSANEIEPADLLAATDERFTSLSWTGPRVVAARLPTDPQERSDLAFSGFAGRDVQNQPRYYVGYDDEAINLLARASPLETLRAKGERAAATIDAWLALHAEVEPTTVLWLPLDARKASAAMLLDAKTGGVITPIDVDPY